MSYSTKQFRELVNTYKGAEVVGFRYGKAPANGRSYNTRDQKFECGVSLASALNLPEVLSFAVFALKEEKERIYYFKGKIAGRGGDGEICIEDAEPITKREYQSELKKKAKLANLFLDTFVCNEKEEEKAEILEAHTLNESKSEPLPELKKVSVERAKKALSYTYTIFEVTDEAGRILGIDVSYLNNMIMCEYEKAEAEAYRIVREARAKLAAEA